MKSEHRIVFYCEEDLYKAIEDFQAEKRVFNRSEALRRIVEEYLKREGLLQNDKKQ